MANVESPAGLILDIRHSTFDTGIMQCPICKQPVDIATAGKEGSTFPFCSDRCRTIDLARWLDGKYQIPVLPDDESHGGDGEPDER